MDTVFLIMTIALAAFVLGRFKGRADVQPLVDIWKEHAGSLKAICEEKEKLFQEMSALCDRGHENYRELQRLTLSMLGGKDSREGEDGITGNDLIN